MFVTDTVDAIYPPNTWSPQAIMDRLGEILSEPHVTPLLASAQVLTPPALPLPNGKRFLRGPKLIARRVDKITDLQVFFSGISLSSFESVYDSGSGKIDWEAVEKVLVEEIFEGEA